MVRSSLTPFLNAERIKNFIQLMLIVFPFMSTLAQPSHVHTAKADTLEIPPGIVHASVLIKEHKRDQLTIEIIEVIAEGQGISNRLSKGQVLTLTVTESNAFRKSKTMKVFLKEKLGVDASQSSYTLLRAENNE